MHGDEQLGLDGVIELFIWGMAFSDFGVLVVRVVLAFLATKQEFSTHSYQS